MAKNQKNVSTNVVENVDTTNETVNAVETTNETVNVPVSLPIRTPMNVLDDALKYGLIDEVKHTALYGILSAEIIDISLLIADFDKQITKRKQDVLGEVYTAIDNAVQVNDLATVNELMTANEITSIVLIRNIETNLLTIKRGVTATATRSVGEGTKTKAGAYRFTNGVLTFDNIRKMVEHYVDESKLSTHMSGKSLVSKLKAEATTFNVNEWTATNQDDNTTENYAVWSAGKYGVQFK